MATPAPQHLACPAGRDPAELARTLRHAHEEFVETGRMTRAVRPVVAQSWARSLAEGVDPETSAAELQLDSAELRAARADHPLLTVMPVIRRLLVEDAADAGLLVAVSDAIGRLLWVEGSRSLRARAEGMLFTPGANWSEAHVGTNAPGTALALDLPVQIFGAEHLSRPVTPWSCSAAPIHDPDTGALLGVLDLTGGHQVASSQSLALVRATVAAVEAQLRIERLSSRQPTPPTMDRRGADRAMLRVLGVRGAVLGQSARSTQLSLRHSELLLLLASAPQGMSGGELARALSRTEQATVTVRAELSRLRTLVDPMQMQSRPYRLTSPLRTDVDRVRKALAEGQLRRAVTQYQGPILPQSQSPGVVAMREELHAELRAVLVDAADPDALLGFADTAHGRCDLGVWESALAAMPANSPRRPQVQAHVARLRAAPPHPPR